MPHPVAFSRVQTLRALRWQAVATCMVALAWWPVPGWGGRAALAALAGGTVMVLSGWVSMLVALGGGIAGASGALGRVLAGVLVKWVVVALGLLMALGVLRLPSLPLISAVVAMVAAYIAANVFPNQPVSTKGVLSGD